MEYLTHNGARDGVYDENLSWPGFLNDNFSISVSEIWQLLEKSLFSFEQNFLSIVSPDWHKARESSKYKVRMFDTLLQPTTTTNTVATIIIYFRFRCFNL